MPRRANLALQRAAASRHYCNRRAAWPPSLSLGRSESMTLAFEAKFVDCADAIGGEILQVSFDTVPSSRAEDDRCTPYVLISRNFEFPGSATVEWHDGKDY